MSYWLEPGGTERQLAEVAKRLDRSRFEPHVGVIRMYGRCVPELRDAGVPLVEFKMRGFLRPSHLRAIAKLRSYIREQNIDIVHTFDVPATLFAVPAAHWSSANVVLSSQRAYRGLTESRRPFLRLTDHMVDGIVVNSNAVRDELIRIDRVPPERIHLCQNGLNTSAYFPQDNPREGPIQIGVVAGLRPEKSIDTLIEAVSHLPNDTHLTIVGSGPMLPQLESQAQQLNLTDRCHFEPATNEVAEWLRRFDIFVLPSQSEALSNALMEAIACGCCAVASRVGGNPELIEDQVTGLLFESGNAQDLAEKLKRLINNPEERTRLAAEGARRTREQFSMEASIQRMEAIYDKFYPRKSA